MCRRPFSLRPDGTVWEHIGKADSPCAGQRLLPDQLFEHIYAPTRDLLVQALEQIECNDTNYVIRYGLVWQAVSLAVMCGIGAGVRLDPSEPEWPVAYIDLPTGQVSWHMPQFADAWDGHDTAEKYRRVREFVEGAR